jgi:F-type H+-transporting ATPase subunit gamma
MKMVSSSKLLKTQRGILGLRPYAAGLQQMISNLNNDLLPHEQSRFTQPGQGAKALLLCVASNKGLCGTYNALVIKRTLDHIKLLQSQGFDVELLLIGRKVEEYFKKREFEIYSTNNQVIDQVNYKESADFANSLMELFDAHKFARIDAVYNHFRNAVMQDLVTEQLLPVPEFISNKSPSGEKPKYHIEPPALILEPTRKEVAESLIPKFIQFNTYRILLDASASEHGARMTAMQKATDNASELLKNLTLTYNKVRQAMITREIVEIVSGAEVFNE